MESIEFSLEKRKEEIKAMILQEDIKREAAPLLESSKKARFLRETQIEALKNKTDSESIQKIKELKLLNESSIEHVDVMFLETAEEKVRGKNSDEFNLQMEGEFMAVESYIEMPEKDIEREKEFCSEKKIKKLEAQLTNLKRQNELLEIAKKFR